MSNVGKWDKWYEGLTDEPSSFLYGDTETYEKGANYLHDCRIVEDWGTGAGGFKRFRSDAIGVDGSNTPHAEKKYIDLTQYTTECDGIFMRHVLEHNYEWKSILHNLLKSFTKKVCIVLFTDMTDTSTVELNHNLKHGVDVPDLSLCRDEFHSIIEGYNVSYRCQSLRTPTGYGVEHIYYLWRDV